MWVQSLGQEDLLEEEMATPLLFPAEPQICSKKQCDAF